MAHKENMRKIKKRCVIFVVSKNEAEMIVLKSYS